ncbi:MAG: 50S ribosomal protein L11 methyltransferase [Candidatus Sulfobium sp.]
MVYYAVSIKAPEESREAVINRMMELGSTGISETSGDLLAYFEDQGQIDRIVDELRLFRDVLRSSGLDSDFSYDYSLLSDRDWNENWKKTFLPMAVGEHLTIIPSWLKGPPDRIPVIIDPGMVFGTGYHETTRTCLAMIEKYSPRTNKNIFVDVGTGTGVLAIGAARLGFRTVVAVDTDPMAVEASLKNAQLNGLDNMSVIPGDITAVDGSFDFAAANLLSEILVGIAPGLARRLNPDGIAVLSGMLPGQDVDVLSAFTGEGFFLTEKTDTGKWVTLVVSRGD